MTEKRFCMLLRYDSLYIEIVENLLSSSDVKDYIFTNKINMISAFSAKKYFHPQKGIGLIITLNKKQLVAFEKLFQNTIEENAELIGKIKYFIIPVYKEG